MAWTWTGFKYDPVFRFKDKDLFQTGQSQAEARFWKMKIHEERDRRGTTSCIQLHSVNDEAEEDVIEDGEANDVEEENCSTQEKDLVHSREGSACSTASESHYSSSESQCIPGTVDHTDLGGDETQLGYETQLGDETQQFEKKKINDEVEDLEEYAGNKGDPNAMGEYVKNQNNEKEFEEGHISSRFY